MPVILASPNEVRAGSDILIALVTSGFEIIEDNIAFDFLLYTNSGPIARERKVYPSDFVASAADGRFSRECAAMREASRFPGVIREGVASFTHDGYLRNGRRPTGWTAKSLRNLERSLRFIEGCDIEETKTPSETANLLLELQAYFDQLDHISLRQRPRLQSDWPMPTQQERYIHWLQGLPGVGIHHATRLAKLFPNPPSLFEASVEQIRETPRLGKGLAARVYEFLHRC